MCDTDSGSRFVIGLTGATPSREDNASIEKEPYTIYNFVKESCMARYIGPRCRKCRQMGFSVCGSGRCALERRTAPPGMHPTLRRKTSDFKKHLVEKQKLQFYYWLNERQFRNYVKKAARKQGVAGETLLGLLERRLDNMVFRLGFAPTRPAARQLVTHGHILINNHRTNIPSYLVRRGEEISLAEKSRKLSLVEEGMAKGRARPMPSYIAFDQDHWKGTLTSIPTREQIPLEINEGLVMEHYTKYI